MTRVRACGIYARISSDDGTALGVGRQIEDCTAEASKRGWPVARTFIDNDVSATKSKRRPEYEHLMQAIEDGDIDAVIVWDVDRLTRTPAELERFIDLADRHHLALASIGGEVDLSTPQGRLTARIKGSVARHEVEQMSRRLKRKFQDNAKEGKSHGVVPFGYRRVRVHDDNGRDIGSQDVIDPAEAEAVRELYRRVIAGESLRFLAKYLNENGFTTIRGNPFQGNVVGAMLRRPRYAGMRTHQRQVVGKGEWPPIVSLATYEEALAILNAPGRRLSRGAEPKYLLSGIAVCGRCGTAMRPNVHKPKNGKHRQPAYICPGCNKVTRKIEAVDEVVEEIIVARLIQPGADIMTSTDPEALSAAIDDREALLARMDTAADNFAQGAITARQLARITEALTIQVTTAEAAIAKLRPSRVLDGAVGVKAAETWVLSTVERKRQIIRHLAEVTILPSGPGIRFSPEQVRVEWKAARS